MNGFRSFLYAMARMIGHINAVSKGPGAMVKRAGRVVAYRAIFRLLRKVGL